MISADDAIRLILAASRRLPAERVPLALAARRVLAAGVSCVRDLPPFDASAMDGYAVRASDCAGAGATSPVRLRTASRTRAGAAAAAPLGPGEAGRVMTGAVLPDGADAVLMQEAVELDGDQVRVARAPRSGQHIRRRGEDVRAGTPLLQEGAILRPYEVALLAAQGIVEVFAIRRPRVAVVTTGDELTEGPADAPGKIPDALGPALAAALSRWDCEAVRPSPVPDDRAALRAAFEAALASADALLVAGGVSVGEFDFTRPALEDLGLKVFFAGVAIKPGKPLLFGTIGDKPVFGLPGNPVAALVCAEEFARPALERMQGLGACRESFHVLGVAENDYPKPADRRQYLFCRARLEQGEYRLEILRPQGSAMLAMASRADALAVAPEGADRVRAGDRLRFRWLK